jgi:hypothetical protein
MVPEDLTRRSMRYIYDDGGRAAAGFKGKAGDCGTRAFALARFGARPTGEQYREVYEDLSRVMREWAFSGPKNRKKDRYRSGQEPCTPRNGMWTEPLDLYAAELGWEWFAAKKMGRTIHMNPAELPGGRLVTRQAKHFAAVIDGAVYDIWDSSISRTMGPEMRMVYGYWLRQ